MSIMTHSEYRFDKQNIFNIASIVINTTNTTLFLLLYYNVVTLKLVVRNNTILIYLKMTH